MKVIFIPVVIGATSRATKGFIKGLGALKINGLETIQHYNDLAEYQEESWWLEETCCHLNSAQKPSGNTNMKIYQGVNNDNNNDNTSIITIKLQQQSLKEEEKKKGKKLYKNETFYVAAYNVIEETRSKCSNNFETSLIDFIHIYRI